MYSVSQRQIQRDTEIKTNLRKKERYTPMIF